ncbi:hypothetical protein DFH09DRAFT_373151 [Mycena vulgaris]|nr:hypothetical protein DFH09DRAFT_373151 [Mycena vulgaris]
MAPELLTGSPVRPPSDVYVFGMTIYELHTAENPMSHVAYGNFVEVVFRLGVRPRRPEPEDFPKLTDPVWSLAESCWAMDAKSRPTSQRIHNTITNIISTILTRVSGRRTDEEELVLAKSQEKARRRSVPLPVEELAELHQQVESQRKALGDNHPDTLTAMDNFSRNCNPRTAQEIGEMVLEMRKTVLGGDHPDTLGTMSYLAHTYHALGRFSEAKTIGEAAMLTRTTVLGSNHPDTLATKGLLIEIYYELGHYKDAEDVRIVVTEEMAHALGPDHPSTLNAMNNLDKTYQRLGRLTEAESIQLAVVAGWKWVCGETDPETLRAIQTLTATYHHQGRFEEAAKRQVAVVEGFKESLGGIHPDTMTAMANLSKTYRGVGKLREAAELQAEVMVRRRRFLGSNHPDTLASMEDLASMLNIQGRTADAKALTEALDKIRNPMTETIDKIRKPKKGYTPLETQLEDNSKAHLINGMNRDIAEMWPIRVLEDSLRFLGSRKSTKRESRA